MGRPDSSVGDQTGRHQRAAERPRRVLPKGTRPAPEDFAPPDPDPDGTDAVGVWVEPVSGYITVGIWAKDVATQEPVLEPAQVGWITRTLSPSLRANAKR
jgi:hypothetical protein